MNKLILVVLYEMNLESSPTINSLLLCVTELNSGDTIFLWDNSKLSHEYLPIANFFETHGVNFVYYHAAENTSMAELYNYVIEKYKHSAIDYLILFDHDTTFDSVLFKSFIEASALHDDVNLFLPRIFYKSKLISPCRVFFLKGFYCKPTISGKFVAKYFSAINSGMIISFKYLNNFSGYDERMEFYGTDMFFMRKYCLSKKEKLFILNYDMVHDMTLSTLNDSSDKLKSVYKKMLRAWGVLYDDSEFLKLLVKCYSVVHSIYMSLKYRDIDYLFIK